ncbi:MAG: hypothetical protein JWP89_1126 [Schlesneria sp.]|nr:hypothetical protein [Schlesneria sp.]
MRNAVFTVVVAEVALLLFVFNVPINAGLPGRAVPDSALNEIVAKSCGVSPRVVPGTISPCTSNSGKTCTGIGLPNGPGPMLGCTPGTPVGAPCGGCSGKVTPTCAPACPTCGCAITVPCCSFSTCSLFVNLGNGGGWDCMCIGAANAGSVGPNILAAVQGPPCIP